MESKSRCQAWSSRRLQPSCPLGFCHEVPAQRHDRRNTDALRRDHAGGLHGLRSRAEAVQRRAGPCAPARALPAQGPALQAGQQPQGRLRPAPAQGVRRTHPPLPVGWALLVRLLLRRKLRRSTADRRPPVHREPEATHLTVTPKTQRTPALRASGPRMRFTPALKDSAEKGVIRAGGCRWSSMVAVIVGGPRRMSLELRADVGVPELTARVVRAAFAKGTLAVRIREALGPLFEDAAFAGAFPSRGRPAVSPGALALVSVLQYAEGLTDRQAADQVRARMDWKFLLGLELDDPGFDASVLSLFRARLIEHGLEQRTLELVLERLRELGLLKAGGRQRTDSTHVLAAVRTLNRMEFVGETLRAALEALAVAAPTWLSGLVTAEWAERYGPRVDDYRFPKGEEVREEWARQVGEDGFF